MKQMNLIEIRGVPPTADPDVSNTGREPFSMICAPVFENGVLVAIEFRHYAYRMHVSGSGFAITSDLVTS